MFFSYKAKSKAGDITEGVLEAAGRLALARDLRARGLIPLSVTEENVNFLSKLSALTNVFSRISVNEQIVFTKNLSGMLKAGLSLFRALSVLKKQTKNAKMDKVLTSLSNDINSGETLSSGLLKFPDIFSNLFISKFMAKYIDYTVIRIPIIGNLARSLNTARTARTMYSLLLAGVSITR